MTTPSEQEWRNEFRNLWKRYPRSQAENLQGLNSLIESFFSRKKREWEAAAYERGFKDGSKWNEVKESDIQSMVARARRETLEEVKKKMEEKATEEIAFGWKWNGDNVKGYSKAMANLSSAGDPCKCGGRLKQKDNVLYCDRFDVFKKGKPVCKAKTIILYPE